MHKRYSGFVFLFLTQFLVGAQPPSKKQEKQASAQRFTIPLGGKLLPGDVMDEVSSFFIGKKSGGTLRTTAPLRATCKSANEYFSALNMRKLLSRSFSGQNNSVTTGTELSDAVKKGSLAYLKLALEYGADPFVQDQITGNTSLHVLSGITNTDWVGSPDEINQLKKRMTTLLLKYLPKKASLSESGMLYLSESERFLAVRNKQGLTAAEISQSPKHYAYHLWLQSEKQRVIRSFGL